MKLDTFTFVLLQCLLSRTEAAEEVVLNTYGIQPDNHHWMGLATHPTDKTKQAKLGPEERLDEPQSVQDLMDRLEHGLGDLDYEEQLEKHQRLQDLTELERGKDPDGFDGGEVHSVVEGGRGGFLYLCIGGGCSAGDYFLMSLSILFTCCCLPCLKVWLGGRGKEEEDRQPIMTGVCDDQAETQSA